MAERRGRPPKPVEEKRRTGNPGKRKLPEQAEVVHLAMAPDAPEPPADLGVDGTRLWQRAWGRAIAWLAPESDMDAVEQACRLVDDVAVARRRYRATSDPADARALVAVQKELSGALSTLGFDPSARSRLGLAEVKRVSKLDELRSRKQGS